MAYWFLGVGMLCLIAEMLTPSQFIFFSFFLSLTITGIIAFFYANIYFLLILTILISASTWFIFQKLPFFHKKSSDYQGNMAEYIHHSVKIIEKTHDFHYRIQIFDETWHAISTESFNIGDIAYIEKIEGTILSITKTQHKEL